MKKTFLLVAVIFATSVFSISGFCQIKFNSTKYINGFWGDWQENPFYCLRGGYNDFVICSDNSHPSEYIMKVTIIGMPVEVNKQARKLMDKSNEWYKYSGTVEYFVNQEYPDIKTQLISWPNPYKLPKATSLNVTRKISAATIKVQPYRKDPSLYNIYFDEVGIGIQL